MQILKLWDFAQFCYLRLGLGGFLRKARYGLIHDPFTPDGIDLCRMGLNGWFWGECSWQQFYRNERFCDRENQWWEWKRESPTWKENFPNEMNCGAFTSWRFDSIIFTLPLVPWFILDTDYHPIMKRRNLMSLLTGTLLLSISAGWSSVSIGWMLISPVSTWWRKWCIWTFMCFVRGRVLWIVAISSAPLLSSKTSQCTRGTVDPMLNPLFFISLANSMIGIVCLRAVLKL